MFVSIEYLYPSNTLLLLIVLVIALALDYVYPYHSGLLLKIHPVHTSFILAKIIGREYSSKLRGILTWFFVVGLHIVIYGLALYMAWTVNVLLWIAIASYITKTSISIRLLLDIVRRAYKCAEVSDWSCARFWTQQIVRRNVYELNEKHVLSAAIESLAESLVDGFTSPLLYFLFLGPMGALLQRIANTLDGALGFRTPAYKDVGWFSAKVDTILNYIPARLTAITILLLCKHCKRAWAFHIWRTFARRAESVNAGHPMSAMAGALGVELEKPGHYKLGIALRDLTPKIVALALENAKRVILFWITISILTLALLYLATS